MADTSTTGSDVPDAAPAVAVPAEAAKVEARPVWWRRLGTLLGRVAATVGFCAAFAVISLAIGAATFVVAAVAAITISLCLLAIVPVALAAVFVVAAALCVANVLQPYVPQRLSQAVRDILATKE